MIEQNRCYHLVADLALAWIAAEAKRAGVRFRRGADLSQRLDIQSVVLHDSHSLASNLWGAFDRVKRDLPRLRLHFACKGVMTTAMMYRDYADGKTNLPCLVTTDCYCPLTDVYKADVSDEMRRLGKKVWWYVCCSPKYPYANFASLECRSAPPAKNFWRVKNFFQIPHCIRRTEMIYYLSFSTTARVVKLADTHA